MSRAARVTVVVSLAVAALALGALLDLAPGGSSAGAPAGEEGLPARRAEPPSTETETERRLAAALREGVERAARLGGDIEAAAMLDASPAPIVSASAPGGGARPMRMWSMAKVATTIALLRLLGWDERPGESLSAEVASALDGALTRSENCRQRRVVLELQRAAGGIEAARRAFEEVFAVAGADAVPGVQVETPEPLCVPFLEGQRGTPEPLAPAVLLGTSRWRVGDAARLAHALATDAYGRPVSELVLGLLRERKQPSRESEPGELTAPLDWGAGSAFPQLLPAYKAGWGGTLNGNFLAGQIAVVALPGGDHLSLAAIFHPDSQPARDDPGITAAPEAIETVMESVRSSLFAEGVR